MQAFGASKHTQDVIDKIAKSDDYLDLDATERNDYMFWQTYWMLNYDDPSSYYYCYNNYYVWMPYYLYERSTDIHVVKEAQTAAQKHDLKWIRVGKVVIAVPKDIYNKAKVGNSVELIDNTHIKIDGHVYKR